LFGRNKGRKEKTASYKPEDKDDRTDNTDEPPYSTLLDIDLLPPLARDVRPNRTEDLAKFLPRLEERVDNDDAARVEHPRDAERYPNSERLLGEDVAGSDEGNGDAEEEEKVRKKDEKKGERSRRTG
jgi:hypothetical protein